MTKHSTSEVVMYLQFIKKKPTNHINFNNGDRQEFRHFEQIKKNIFLCSKKNKQKNTTSVLKICILKTDKMS